MLCQELDIYICNMIIDMDFLLSVQQLHHFSQVLFMECLKFFLFFCQFSKVGRSVIGWQSG